MSNNINQILSRNINTLTAKQPLFINISPNGFAQEYMTTNPEASVHCYNTNFEEYTQYKANKNINASFSATYTSNYKHDVVIIAFPKSKEELNFTLNMLSSQTTENATIFIVGENKSGIKSVEKLTKNTLNHCQKIDSARHCLLYASVIQKNSVEFAIEDWYQYYDINIDNINIKVAALPGVFSHKGLDKGTKVLLDNLPEIKGNKLLDFGCGSGVIASFIGKQYPSLSLNLLDVSALALACAEKTLAINNLSGKVFPSNSLSEVNSTYDTVISNPPFHQGVKTNYAATESFLKGVSQYINNKGEVIVVANSFLQYEPIMKSAIGKAKKINTTKGFTIYLCTK